jgi:hypothetical protein
MVDRLRIGRSLQLYAHGEAGWSQLFRTLTVIACFVGAVSADLLAQTADSRVEVPAYEVHHGSGNFTGFNSVDLQKMYVLQKQQAIRSQISPPSGQKPCLARLPNGDLLATQQLHGVIALCRSTDNGLSWTPPQLVTVPGKENLPGRAAMFAALWDGTLLLGYHGMYRSTDAGKTWQECAADRSVTYDGRTFEIGWGENSGPHELSNGTVICCGYVNVVPGHARAYLLRSADGGRNWGDPSLIADYCSEVNLVVLPGDRLFACLRQGTQLGDIWAGEGGVVLAVASSDDRGRTWTAPRKLLGKAQSPGFPVRLSDGRLIIVFTHRQFPFGVQAIASRDGGETWDVDHPAIIAWNSFDAYCGHPRSLVLPDDTIVSGFYVRAFHSRGYATPDVVGHCVRWRAPANWPGQWPPNQAPLTPPAGQQPVLELPASAPGRMYSGYNSLDLQKIDFTEKRPVVRSQISPRGGHKPCLALLPGEELLATQLAAGHVALCRSTDGGANWEPPTQVVVPGGGKLPGRARQFTALSDGRLLLAHDKMFRSDDRGRTWQACRLPNTIRVDGRQYPLRMSESGGPYQLPDGTLLCAAFAALGGTRMDVRLADDGQDGQWDEAKITWNNAPDNYNTLLGTYVDTVRDVGDRVDFAAVALVDALNKDTNDVLDLRMFAAAETERIVQQYYATRENKRFPGPKLVVDFANDAKGSTTRVVLEPTDDALTRGGLHGEENNETGPHIDIGRMWISCPARPLDDQTMGYLKFNLSPITGRVITASLRLTTVHVARQSGSGADKAFLLRSVDRGQTWGEALPVASARELNLVLLPGGKLFACVTLAADETGSGPGVVGVMESTDNGRSWTSPRRIEGLGSAQFPGEPLSLPDGRLLIVYGNRQFPFGVQAIASRDGGQTWDTDHPILLAWFSWDHHCGYPRSVLRPDGSIITGYYTRTFTGVPDGIVYTPTDRDPSRDVVGHSVRWRPPENWLVKE